MPAHIQSLIDLMIHASDPDSDPDAKPPLLVSGHKYSVLTYENR